MNYLLRNRDAAGVYYYRFYLPQKAINWSFSTIDRKQY